MMGRPKKPRPDLDAEAVGTYYAENTRAETAKHFGVSVDDLRRFLKENGIQRDGVGFSDPKTADNRNRSMRRLADDPKRVHEASEKRRATMKDKYGDENYAIHAAKRSFRERTGISEPLSSPDVRRKRARTLQERHEQDDDGDGSEKI